MVGSIYTATYQILPYCIAIRSAYAAKNAGLVKDPNTAYRAPFPRGLHSRFQRNFLTTLSTILRAARSISSLIGTKAPLRILALSRRTINRVNGTKIAIRQIRGMGEGLLQLTHFLARAILIAATVTTAGTSPPARLLLAWFGAFG